MRIGVFVCHCGSNIASTVDVEEVARKSLELPYVKYAADIKYTCSDPGQKTIRTAIEEHSLTRIVIAACTPKIHEPTFRENAGLAQLNPYLVEMANIREHCSWVHENRGEATGKALLLVKKAVGKAAKLAQLFPSYTDVDKNVLVIGGGIAGIQASLDLANAGIKVWLVEKTPSIGGNMAKLDKTFPTIDCSACILTPKMVDVKRHKNIELMSYSEVDSVSGYVGNFDVRIRQKASYVDYEKCIGCGVCQQKCPYKSTNEFDAGIGQRKAIYIPFAQAVPLVATIEKDACRFFRTGKCKICQKLCPVDAVDFDMTDRVVEKKFGSIILATGFQEFDHSKYGEYGGGQFKDVLSGMQYERILSASGPTGGLIKRQSSGETPENIVFISCVGSRDDRFGHPYCSGICCMYIAKQAMLTKEHLPDSKVTVFYTDIRANGKAYEEFVRRAQEYYGVQYVRGRVSRIFEEDGRLTVGAFDTLLGEDTTINADLVVLGTGIEPDSTWKNMAGALKISTDSYGFYLEGHPKLRPVEANRAGVFLAGTCQAPKDIPSTIAQASAAASKTLGLLSTEKLQSDPMVSCVAEAKCIGCFRCRSVCPYDAIESIQLQERSFASVNKSVCEGCGNCNPACPTGAMSLLGYTNDQIVSEVMAVCQT